MTKKERKRKKEFKRLLAQFSSVLLDKLLANERKYKFGDSWKIPNWELQLQTDLRRHVEKGDPRDTAIFSLFAWYHKWPTYRSYDAPEDMVCRQCGCHEQMACYHGDYGPCWWVEVATDQHSRLCSHCKMENEGKLDGPVERPWQK